MVIDNKSSAVKSFVCVRACVCKSALNPLKATQDKWKALFHELSIYEKIDLLITY